MGLRGRLLTGATALAASIVSAGAAFAQETVTAAAAAAATDGADAVQAASAAQPSALVNALWWVAPIGSVIGLIVAFAFYKIMMTKDEGTETMRTIASYVRKGADAYLWQQYKIVAMIFIVLALIFAFLAYVVKAQNVFVPFAFLTGGFFSGLSGFLGMKTATRASARTAAAAKNSLNQGLTVAFRAGAVMGLVVVGLGLLDISIWYVILSNIYTNGLHWGFINVDAIDNAHERLNTITTTMLTFGMGASTQALFARVGGGIFTKAADVGADLVGKVEAGIPEDDPRNPAVIADNVGDNVGDVAGMGADLYESYCGSVLSTAALGVAAGFGLPGVFLPLVIAGVGTVFSVIGMFVVRTREDAGQKELMAALNRGIFLATFLIAIASLVLTGIFLPEHKMIGWSIIVGLVAGIGIAKSAEFYTSNDYEPTKSLAKQTLTGPATVIIDGVALGMLSTGLPVVTVSVGTILAFGLAGGFSGDPNAVNWGLYGVAIASVGMLATLGITLATDAYGPIADNAGGNAEMSHLDPEVRKRTDALDSLGNTTAATGKGFAIGSAALTAMALLAAYIEEIRIGLVRLANQAGSVNLGGQTLTATEIYRKPLAFFMQTYDITILNPKVIVGAFLGAMMVFVFCALTMKAVGRAAGQMVEEVRRQFKAIPGIMEGKATPDYAACVAISTKAAQREMILPSLLAIAVPFLAGLLLDVAGVMGLLMGSLATGFSVAIMMANAGGAWDNAKKYIENGNYGGKGSQQHKASVVGDTVGDPFKDTSGPSLNILLKLMSMVAIVFAGVTVKFAPAIAQLLHISRAGGQ
jgi:K(+)-stimulated pyrophosphate-energized sodium pump